MKPARAWPFMVRPAEEAEPSIATTDCPMPPVRSFAELDKSATEDARKAGQEYAQQLQQRK